VSDAAGDAGELFRRAYEAQTAGKIELAVDLYRRSIEASPTAEAHTFLGWAYSFLGRYGEAIAECEKAIRLDPEFGNPYNDIGAYLIELGRHDEAIGWLERATRASRYEPRHYPHYNLARVHGARGEYDKALKELEKALALEPGYALARRELGRIVARLN
jgi:tetratricopeptide (TPR) repeat protein